LTRRREKTQINKIKDKKGDITARHQVLMPIILATQEAAIRMIMVQRQPGKIVCNILS
jgi:hypothetical protein